MVGKFLSSSLSLFLFLVTTAAVLILISSSNILYSSSSSLNYFENKELIENYLNWIVENSEFEYNNEPFPEIKLLDSEILQIYAYGGEVVARSERENFELQNILALYLYEKDTIFISNDIDLNYFRNHHIIIHELVHYLQDINGYYEKVSCQKLLEKDAYRIQEKWMREFYDDDDFIDKMLPNDLYILMLELSCKEHHGNF